jgi:hypothetical protein
MGFECGFSNQRISAASNKSTPTGGGGFSAPWIPVQEASSHQMAMAQPSTRHTATVQQRLAGLSLSTRPFCSEPGDNLHDVVAAAEAEILAQIFQVNGQNRPAPDGRAKPGQARP